jgi:hypothetical protein
VAIKAKDATSDNGPLHHHGTIAPDGAGFPELPGNDITGFDGTYPNPAFSLPFDAPAPATAPHLTATAASAGGTDEATVAPTPAIQSPVLASSGLVINAHYDTSITDLTSSNPTLYTDITGAISAAVQFYEAAISNSITINIDFGYGEVGGSGLSGNNIGQSKNTGFNDTFGTLKSALASHATSSADATAVASLPAADPTGDGTWYVPYGEAKALGLYPGTGTEVDGDVGLSDTTSFDYNPSDRAVSGEYDAIGVLEHEISEVMGRLEAMGTYFGSGIYTALDLFRFSAAGTHDLTPGPGYFSINSGTTDLAQFNDPTHGGDAGDWASSVTHDAYDASSAIGVANTVSATDLTVMDVIGYTLATACFAEGTRIRTERGMVTVETLRIGDRVPVLLGGEAQPIIWLGQRRVDCRRHPDPKSVWPICLRAGAFGPGRPFRDLWLSPDHALFINNVLLPIRHLVNGQTIRQQPRDEVTYWHVELAKHSVLHAEGVPAESYLDTGNRSAFANGGPVVALHPDFTAQAWEMRSCAPLVQTGPKLAAARSRLLVRATAMGHATTDNPDLVMLVNGRQTKAVTDGRIWRVQLPRRTQVVDLISRAWTPAYMQSDTHDTRTLGVAIAQLWLDRRAVPWNSRAFTSGWHEPEQDWRWTDGAGALAVAGARELAFALATTGTYWRDAVPSVHLAHEVGEVGAKRRVRVPPATHPKTAPRLVPTLPVNHIP